MHPTKRLSPVSNLSSDWLRNRPAHCHQEVFEMPFGDGPVPKQILLVVGIVLSLSARSAVVSDAAEKLAGQQSSAQAPAAARPVGTIKSISGNTIVLTTDAGADVIIQVQDPAKLVRIAPGQKDLKDVTPIQSADRHPGYSILVTVKPADGA